MEHTEEPAPKTTRDKVKLVADFAVGTSVTSVVKTLLRQNVTPKNNLQSVELYIAAYALGGLVAKHATAHIDERIDAAADFVEKAKQEAGVIEKRQREKTEE